jgi:beta-1,4-mannosyl-glycoprotein beta-1,4-N-acetylglucosaminyltransferase
MSTHAGNDHARERKRAKTVDQADQATVASSLTTGKLMTRLRAYSARSFVLLVLLLFVLYRTRKALVSVTRPAWDVTGRLDMWPPNATFIDDTRFYAATHQCASFGFAPRAQRAHVIVSILFNFELEMLELLLHELHTVVSHFVVVEAEQTFTGAAKPLHFERALRNATLAARFAPFRHLVTHVTVRAHELEGVARNPWVREHYSRVTAPFAAIEKLRLVQINDLFLHLDVDEIPRAASLQFLSECALPPHAFPVRIDARFYQYSFEHEVKAPYTSIRASMYTGGALADMRADNRRVRPQTVLADAGWHCSWCFATLEQFAAKFGATSHQEHNAARLRTASRIQACGGQMRGNK